MKPLPPGLDDVRHAALRLLPEETVESVLAARLRAGRFDHHHRGGDRVGDVDECLAQVEGGLNRLFRNRRVGLDDDGWSGRLDEAELGGESQPEEEAARDGKRGPGLGPEWIIHMTAPVFSMISRGTVPLRL